MICCYQVTKSSCTKYGSASASSAWGPRNFCPFTDLEISVFREMSTNTAYPNPHVSCMWALKILREKNWRVSLCSGTPSSTKFSLNSCSHSGISELARPESADNGSHLSILFPFCFWKFLVGLVHNGWPRSIRSTCSLDTSTGRESNSLYPLSLGVAVVVKKTSLRKM